MVDPVQTGGVNDPVAQNIRAQQNRDAAVNQEEAQRVSRERLAEKGCTVCGEDDPDKLSRQRPHMYDCSATQKPPRLEVEVVCEDHAENQRKRWLAEKKEKLNRDGVVALIVYECDLTNFIKEVDDGGSKIPKKFRDPPKASIVCECGAEIKNVYYPEEDE